jgi:glutathione S-transferase
MQLYFSPFACSLASHITLREAGLEAELIAVTLSTKTTATGADFLAVTAKGQVPALRLDDGSVLTEGPAVLQYLADRNPASGLMPAAGRERYAVLQWLNYIGTEIHKACFALMFNPKAPAEAKAWGRELVDEKLAYVDAELGSGSFLVGDRFTIADAYLAWALNIAGLVGVTLPAGLQRYFDALKARPAVAAALAAEGAAAAAARN